MPLLPLSKLAMRALPRLPQLGRTLNDPDLQRRIKKHFGSPLAP